MAKQWKHCDAKPEAVGPLGLYARSVTGLPLRPNNAKKGN